MSGGCGCQGQHNELGLQNVGGVFVLLLGGLVLAFLIGLFEFIYKVRLPSPPLPFLLLSTPLFGAETQPPSGHGWFCRSRKSGKSASAEPPPPSLRSSRKTTRGGPVVQRQGQGCFREQGTGEQGQ